MLRDARSVQRLHLRAESEAAVRGALPALEDAFRTATLPDAGSRLIVVRRLDLGRLPRLASPQHLSLLLESRFARAGARLVHGDDAAANDADGVWFRGVHEAYTLAAQHVAAGHSVGAWFWPLAVPALAAETSPAARLRAIAFALASREEAPAALRAWVVALVRAGHVDRLIAALQPGDGAALLQAAGIPPFRANARMDTRDAPDDAVPRRLHRPEVAAAPRLPARRRDRVTPPDGRVEFIERMVEGTAWRSPAPIEAPSTDGPLDATQIRGTAGTLEQPSRSRRQQPRSGSSRQTRELTRTRSARTPATGTPTAGTPGAPPSTISSPAREKAHAAARSLSVDLTPPPRATSHRAVDASWVPDGQATTAGGIFFIVPVLERVGFGRWCAALDAPPARVAEYAGEVFHALLSRLRIAEEDPAWQLATAFRLKPEATKPLVDSSRGFRLQPEETQNSGGFRLLPEDSTGEFWLSACRRWLRRRARIGLASLVVRPARLALTSTHADMFFALNGADVRVRRAGLDIDPGWVPWLGKVIAFHYEDRPWK
jgi:hypothetical protein